MCHCCQHNLQASWWFAAPCHEGIWAVAFTSIYEHQFKLPHYCGIGDLCCYLGGPNRWCHELWSCCMTVRPHTARHGTTVDVVSLKSSRPSTDWFGLVKQHLAHCSFCCNEEVEMAVNGSNKCKSLISTTSSLFWIVPRCVILGFHHGWNEFFCLLVCHLASGGLILTFWDYLSVPSSGVKLEWLSLTFEDKTDG